MQEMKIVQSQSAITAAFAVAGVAWMALGATPPGVVCKDGETSFYCPVLGDSKYFQCSAPFFEGFMSCPAGTKCWATGKSFGNPCLSAMQSTVSEASSSATSSSSHHSSSSFASSSSSTGSNGVSCAAGQTSFSCPTLGDSKYFQCSAPFFEGFMPCPAGTRCWTKGTTTVNPCTASVQDESSSSQSSVSPSPPPHSDEYRCNATACVAPNCRCCNAGIPGNLPLSDTPQFVMITFDDDLESRFWPLISQVVELSGFDAVGCAVSPAFYLNNEWTNYGTVSTAFNAGDEIACHTYRHTGSAEMSKFEWIEAIESGRMETSRLAGVPVAKVVGFRAPNLLVTPNALSALKELGFLYDTSFGQLRVGRDVGEWMWPCTFDFGLPRLGGSFEGVLFDRFPGLWEIPMHVLNGLDERPFSIMDPPGTPEFIGQLFRRAFDQHYASNRSPFGVFLHASWLLADVTRVDVLADFFRWAAAHQSTFFVTPSQLIQWTSRPVKASDITSANRMCSK